MTSATVRTVGQHCQVFVLLFLFFYFHLTVKVLLCISQPHPSTPPSVHPSHLSDSSVQLRDERMCGHLLQQVGKQTVQRKSGDEGRDRARGHSPYGGPVLRPSLCLYRPQAQLIKLTSDPMWWPLGHHMT